MASLRKSGVRAEVMGLTPLGRFSCGGLVMQGAEWDGVSMETAEQLAALRVASQANEQLRTELAQAQSPQEWVAVAARHGIEVDEAAFAAGDRELTDAELEGAAGGYTFPNTDWVYCDNPWTNAWCTLKC